jgi:hypothetical protein
LSSRCCQPHADEGDQDAGDRPTFHPRALQ